MGQEMAEMEGEGGLRNKGSPKLWEQDVDLRSEIAMAKVMRGRSGRRQRKMNPPERRAMKDTRQE